MTRIRANHDKDGREALRLFVEAAYHFAIHGAHPRESERGSHFHEFAEASVAASCALKLRDCQLLNLEFEKIKRQVTDDNGRVDRQALDMKLLDAAYPFFEIFSRPGSSYGQLFVMAQAEKLLVDNPEHDQRIRQLFANMQSLRSAYRFHQP